MGTTVSRREAVRILAGCTGGRWPDDPRRHEGPPIDGALLSLLVAWSIGGGAGWDAVVALRPDLAGLDGRDVGGVLDRIFGPGASPWAPQ